VAIQLKSPAEIAKMREANLIVAEVLDALEAASKPGVSTWELNEISQVRLRQLKADPAFLNYGHPPYPAVVCTSVNEVVVHGIPRRDVVLKEGDILSIDFGAFKDGWCGDSARTIPIGAVSPAAKALIDATRESLERAIAACVPGNRLGDIGWAVQSHVEKKGYSVVRQFVGHGIGRAMHEEPHVPNYGDAGKGRRPTWQAAAPGPVSEPLYDAFCAALSALGAHVERGVFGAQMQVHSVNEGPFTVLLDR
jgi:methionyl aminopeptidase